MDSQASRAVAPQHVHTHRLPPLRRAWDFVALRASRDRLPLWPRAASGTDLSHTPSDCTNTPPLVRRTSVPMRPQHRRKTQRGSVVSPLRLRQHR